MRQVSRSALLPYSPAQVFDVVNDVSAYQAFLPWCAESTLLSLTEDEMTARLTIRRAGVSQSFVTRNHFHRPERIELELVEGPFEDLRGYWQFTSLGEDGCKVEMMLRFEFNSRLANLALGRVFDQAVETLVDAFCERVEVVYRDA